MSGWIRLHRTYRAHSQELLVLDVRRLTALRTHPLRHANEIPGAIVKIRITQQPRLFFLNREGLPLIRLHYRRGEFAPLAGLRPPRPNFGLKEIGQMSTPRIGSRSRSLDRINSLSDRLLRVG